MQKYEENLLGTVQGVARPLKNVSVAVTDMTGAPALLFSDDGATPISQLTTDENGYFAFKAADGKYLLTFSGSRIATFTREIILEDPADNPYVVKSDLAAFSGATMIGYKRPSDGALLTVSSAIDSISASNSNTILGTLLAGLSTATNAAITTADSILVAFGKLQKQITDWINAKDATGGYAGLTLFKINFKNAANTFTSFLTNANTAARTYTFPDKDGTVAMVADIATPTMYVREERASGTSTSTTMTAASWVVRSLNQQKYNDISGASLASNAITLPAGTYEYDGSAPAYEVQQHITQLYNQTDSAVIDYGTSEMSATSDGVMSRSILRGKFTLAASKAIVIRHWAVSSAGVDNSSFGKSTGITGVTEVYAEIRFRKVA
jgi:hypothetical protein